MEPSGRTVREGKKAEQQVFASCSWNHSSLVGEKDAPSSEFEALGQKQLLFPTSCCRITWRLGQDKMEKEKENLRISPVLAFRSLPSYSLEQK